MIGTITVTASSGTTSVPQVATKSLYSFNIFVEKDKRLKLKRCMSLTSNQLGMV